MASFLKSNIKRAKTAYAFMNNAVQRRVNKQKYLQLDKTPHEIIHQNGLMTVKYYFPLEVESVSIDGQLLNVRKKRFATPIILVPPLGVFAWVFDLMAERSMAKYFLAHGYEVYLIDWGKPGPDDKNIRLEDYVCDWFPSAMQAIRHHSGVQQHSLVGYCMGGLLSLLYLASSQDKNIANLVTIATPVNIHKMGFVGGAYQALSKPIWAIGKVTGLNIENMQRQFFHISGKRLSWIFKMTNPVGQVSGYIELVKNLADDEYVSRYMTMNEWFSNMPDYPGATVQELIRKFGLYNRLAKGKIRLGKMEAHFKDISCPILSIAGTSDAIVPIESAQAILTITSATDIQFEVAPGGHAGVFTGGRAANTTWTKIQSWLAQRSQATS